MGRTENGSSTLLVKHELIETHVGTNPDLRPFDSHALPKLAITRLVKNTGGAAFKAFMAHQQGS
jgi:hypothetical protein